MLQNVTAAELSSRQRCSIKKGLWPATLLKKRLWHRCLPENFVKFLRTPFSQNTSGQLHLYFTKKEAKWNTWNSKILREEVKKNKKFSYRYDILTRSYAVCFWIIFYIFRLDYATLATKNIPSIVNLRLLHSIKIYKSRHKQKAQSRWVNFILRK